MQGVTPVQLRHFSTAFAPRLVPLTIRLRETEYPLVARLRDSAAGSYFGEKRERERGSDKVLNREVEGPSPKEQIIMPFER